MKDLLNIFVSGEPKPQPRTRACVGLTGLDG